MAEAILQGVAQTLIENLGSWAFQEIGSLWNVKDDLENIKNTVSTIQAILQDAAEQQRHNHEVKKWLEKLKDAVYEADDLLSEFYTEALQREETGGNVTKKVCNFLRSSNPLNVFGRRIKEMRETLNAVVDDRIKFHLKECHVESHVTKDREERETHSYVLNEKVIGREEDKKAIIKLLLDDDVKENVSVIPILGIGGLGKTTLAQYAYNDEIVNTYFELKMWVCVSDVFNVKMIVQKIISAIGEKPEVDSMEQLQYQLRKKIDQKKYLLVLDDVWNEDSQKWEKLKDLLIGGAVGSRIVITTGIKKVVDITSPVAIYNLNGLFEDQSWSLFKQIAFRKEQETNTLRLEEIGREIVLKCQGVPLAIKSVGSVLRFKEKELEWLYVKNNMLESVTQQESGIFAILKLSYDHLPAHLKSCFAFCSLFPKDYIIDKVTLIQLWIAQGFIQSSKKQLEDVAEEYFRDLLWRSFFEKVRNGFGDSKYYKMHDLIHDLAQSIAGVECTLINLDKNNIDGRTRHVSCPFLIDSSFIKTPSLVKADNVRTFLLTYDKYASFALKGSMAFLKGLEESTLNTLISSFKSLRALDLHNLKITIVPHSIGKLIHLKYIDLSFNNDIEALPDSITRLRNLQTLKLFCCQKLKELPRDSRKLINLRHLGISYCVRLSHMPCGLGQMTSLHTLPLFVVSKEPPSIFKHVGGLGELKQLNNLRGKLEIRHLEWLEVANSDSKDANLREKQHLEKLILSWGKEVSKFSSDLVDNSNNDDEKLLDGLHPHLNLKSLEVYDFRGVRFSTWLSSLINLVDLKLENCNRCQHLPPLSQLPSLERLDLSLMRDLEYISNSDISEDAHVSSPTSTSFFPLLKSLNISWCPNLKGWWRSASTPDHQQHQSLPSFPRLSFLKIEYCCQLASMPLFPFLEQGLYLDDVTGKPLQQTMSMVSSPPSSSSSPSTPSPLSQLKFMALTEIKDEVSLPSNLNSLKTLIIWNCPRLTSLSGVVRYLTSLEELNILNCDEFNPLSDVDVDGMEWRHVTCLRSMKFRNLQKLESLPVGLQHVVTFKDLYIKDCPNLISFPEWIGELTSLKKLGIYGCGLNPNLRSLPNGISCLTSLLWLKISGLSNLITFPDINFPNLLNFPMSISNLASLEKLRIGFCPNLTSLPNEMPCLKSLKLLRILGCPLLEEKCKRGIGED
ncbi:putative disease resistance protein RGA1 [Castanea sativa]|uniref:putative disease resistance protein RGA1 n=1 Tax=Castanea sativa TaxID=21020 RepID=UPI003F64E3DF